MAWPAAGRGRPDVSRAGDSCWPIVPLDAHSTRWLIFGGGAQSGLDLGESRQELAEGRPEDAIEAAIAWRRAFKQPAAAKTAAARGYRPVDALEGRLTERAAPRAPRREVILSDHGPQPRTTDGTALPRQVLTALGAGQPAVALRAFGIAWCKKLRTHASPTSTPGAS